MNIEHVTNKPVDNKEPGAASILIELSNSVITVIHGEDKNVLAKGEVQAGAWDEIWDALMKTGVQRKLSF